ncbi:MAG: hypothetical protein AAF846_27935 [Chloroflexota bacterium]
MMNLPEAVKVLSSAELPPAWLSEIGLSEEDVLVVRVRDRIIVGSRERVVEQLFDLIDAEWQENELTMEAFLERRPQIAEELLKDMYGLTADDIAT